MAESEMLNVEVAYATPAKQRILKLRVPGGCSMDAAVARSGILTLFPEIDLESSKLGVWGKVYPKRDRQLREGDRIEIYRPLLADPKEVRKQRAAAGKRMSKGGGDVTDSEN
ncbi:MAG: RnfH family protein [Gammaproteobacteria bacterium]|nr:RnfH family protein [Gammaproteobacteria bacterium]